LEMTSSTAVLGLGDCVTDGEITDYFKGC